MQGAISSRSVSTAQACSIGTPTVNSLSSFMTVQSSQWPGPPGRPDDTARSGMRCRGCRAAARGSDPGRVLAHPPDGSASAEDQPGDAVDYPGPVDPRADPR